MGKKTNFTASQNMRRYEQSMSDKRCVYSRGTLEFLTAPSIIKGWRGTLITDTRS